MTESTRRILTIVAAVAVVALLAVGAMLSGGVGGDDDDSKGASESASSSQDDTQGEQLARRDADDVMAMGDKDAPVVLIEYSDYRCPFCGAFARDSMPKLKKEYIDTGKVRFEFRDFPVFGPESLDGAMAARAAGEQDLYWEYHNAMYGDAPERGHLKITDQKITAWAEEVGVPDMKTFEKDLDDPALRSKVKADGEEAAAEVMATGTPTFVLGDQVIVGAQPLETFQRLIDEELERKGEQ